MTDLTYLAAKRLAETRREIERRIWQARSRVVRDWLIRERGRAW